MSKVQLIRFPTNTSVLVHHLTDQPPIFDWHAHDCYELIMLINASGMRYIGNEVAQSSQDEIILIPPFVSHTWDTKANAQDVVVVLFKPELLNSDVPEFRSFLNELRHIKESISLPLDPNTHKDRYVDPITALKKCSPFERVMSLLSVLYQLEEDYKKNTGRISQDREPKMSKFMAYLEDNIKENTASLVHCAEHMNMSISTLKRWLKRDFDSTFSQLYRDIRLKKAQNLLACSRLSISVIAEQSGFNSIRAFNSAFKASFNITPLKYRTNNQWRKNQ